MYLYTLIFWLYIIFINNFIIIYIFFHRIYLEDLIESLERYMRKNSISKSLIGTSFNLDDIDLIIQDHIDTSKLNVDIVD